MYKVEVLNHFYISTLFPPTPKNLMNAMDTLPSNPS